ncbi:hypothetical protein WG66_006949 [Moniliophthora roreri]|nr:hypothetical protein WG66_006949 [Moniliophthora roreri]
MSTNFSTTWRYSWSSANDQLSRKMHTMSSNTEHSQIPFKKGQDLFIKVFYHYSEPPSSEERVANNYVSNDTISPRRLECGFLSRRKRSSDILLRLEP